MLVKGPFCTNLALGPIYFLLWLKGYMILELVLAKWQEVVFMTTPPPKKISSTCTVNMFDYWANTDDHLILLKSYMV